MTQSVELPQTSGAERAVGWVLMIALLIAAVPVAFLGLLLGMVSDGCGPNSAGCNSDQLSIGVALAALGTPAVAVATLVWLIKRNVRRQSIWWVPLVGAASVAVVWVVGMIVAATSVNS